MSTLQNAPRLISKKHKNLQVNYLPKLEIYMAFCGLKFRASKKCFSAFSNWCSFPSVFATLKCKAGDLGLCLRATSASFSTLVYSRILSSRTSVLLHAAVCVGRCSIAISQACKASLFRFWSRYLRMELSVLKENRNIQNAIYQVA